MITFLIYSSTLSSIMTANDPPLFCMFLTLVTNEQWPLSTKNIGVNIPSGSSEKSFVKFEFEHPSLFDSL
jgi:hypothetical protein